MMKLCHNSLKYTNFKPKWGTCVFEKHGMIILRLTLDKRMYVHVKYWNHKRGYSCFAATDLATFRICQVSPLTSQRLNLLHECNLLIMCQILYSHALPSITETDPQWVCSTNGNAVGILWLWVRDAYIIMLLTVVEVPVWIDNPVKMTPPNTRLSKKLM